MASAQPLSAQQDQTMPQPLPADEPVPENHRGSNPRRSVVARRADPGTGLERRRGPGRRRSDFSKAAEEGEMTQEQFLFVTAIDTYKRVNHRPFPTWTEVLEVIRKLGYRKTCPSQLKLDNVEDWTEPADNPAFAPPQPSHETKAANDE